VLPREDFIFTVGYDGPAAVVDRQAKKKYGKLSTKELAEKGLFRAAYSSAVHSGNSEELAYVAETYNRLGGHSPVGQSSFDRLFGVFPTDVKRTALI
jgi:hypothetical protein